MGKTEVVLTWRNKNLNVCLLIKGKEPTRLTKSIVEFYKKSKWGQNQYNETIFCYWSSPWRYTAGIKQADVTDWETFKQNAIDWKLGKGRILRGLEYFDVMRGSEPIQN